MSKNAFLPTGIRLYKQKCKIEEKRVINRRVISDQTNLLFCRAAQILMTGWESPMQEIGEDPLEEGFEKELQSWMVWKEKMENEMREIQEASEKERQENQNVQAALIKDVHNLKQDRRYYATKVGAIGGAATGGVGGGIAGGWAACGSTKAAVAAGAAKGAAALSVAGALIGGAVAYVASTVDCV